MHHRRHFLSRAATLAGAALLPLAARAQAIEQVRILYGFPAGSTGDSVARRVAEKLTGSAYARTAIVDNRPGAGGRIAIEQLKAAPADGSVLALAPTDALGVYPHIYPKLSYRPEDVVTVSTAAIMYMGLAVGPLVPPEVRTLKDFLAWAKAHPELAAFGSPGAGSLPHLLGAVLSLRSGVPLRHVPYRGSAPSINDLVGGQVAAAMNPSGDYLQHLKTGRVRLLATSGHKRSPFFPNVPTFAEQGFPDVTSEIWFGFYAPARTPAATVAAANTAINAALRDKAVIDSFAALGLLAKGSTPQEMLADQQNEFRRWAPLVKEIGFTGES